MGLDSAAREAIRIAERMAEEKIINKNKKLKTWRGKEIVTVNDWHEKLRVSAGSAYLQFLPETFMEVLLFFDHPEDEKTWKDRNHWWEVYCEYLRFTKDPAFGRFECSNCIMNPSLTLDRPSIRNIILKTCENPDLLKYPCEVCNIIQCPYGQGKDNNHLKIFGEVAQILDDAIEYAWETTANIGYTYTVDFVRRLAGRHWKIIERTTNPIEEVLRNLHLSAVPIREIRDIFNSLTNPESLEILLEQYFESVENTLHYDEDTNSWQKSFLEKKKAARLRIRKNFIMRYFDMVKNKFTIEDLQEYPGGTLEWEANYKQEKIQREKERELEDPAYAKKIRETVRCGSCVMCAKFGNILCLNCGSWVCVDHWRQHGSENHNFK